MVDYGTVRSTVEPEAKVVDELSVWVNTDITPVQEGEGAEAFTGFEFHQVQYNKDEYIKMIDEKNASQLTTVIVKLENIGNDITEIKGDLRDVTDAT